MVMNRLDLHPLLVRSILYLLSGFQVFHRTDLRISVIILVNHYVVSLFYVDITFPQPYVNLTFRILHLKLYTIV